MSITWSSARVLFSWLSLITIQISKIINDFQWAEHCSNFPSIVMPDLTAPRIISNGYGLRLQPLHALTYHSFPVSRIHIFMMMRDKALVLKRITHYSTQSLSLSELAFLQNFASLAFRVHSLTTSFQALISIHDHARAWPHPAPFSHLAALE